MGNGWCPFGNSLTSAGNAADTVADNDGWGQNIKRPGKADLSRAYGYVCNGDYLVMARRRPMSALLKSPETPLRAV